MRALFKIAMARFSRPAKWPLQLSEKGFALIAAIMACLILFALAILVISLSTQDLRTSTKVVGDKKALAAAEAGIHKMTQTFDPQNLAAAQVTSAYVTDPHSVYAIGTATRPSSGPEDIPLAGYSIGGGQQWGQRRFVVNVDGRNTEYNTHVTIGVGIGYGPIEITTMFR
jgi:Tfp pilus assembly protein PilX